MGVLEHKINLEKQNFIKNQQNGRWMKCISIHRCIYVCMQKCTHHVYMCLCMHAYAHANRHNSM